MLHGVKVRVLFTDEDAINTVFFVGLGWVEGGEGLGEGPIALIAADAFVYEEAFEGFAPACGTENHALVDAIEDGIS